MENYFAKNLKYLRKKKNIDQSVMAEEIGVAQSTLSCWENGIRMPDLNMVAKISKYLNIYEDFITKDLTKMKNDKPDEIELLIHEYKDILTEADKKIIKTVVLERIKESERG